MKILFFASGTIRSNFSYRILALGTALSKRGFEISIVAPSADKYNNFIPEKISSIDGVKIIQPFQFTTRRPEINLIPYLYGALVALVREKPDLVYIYKPTPISAIGLMAKKLMHDVPVVADIDDLGSEVMRIEGHPWHQRKLVEWSERFATYHADRLVVASSYLLHLYGRRFPGKPIQLIPNGADAQWFEPTTPSSAARQIVFMGAINRKNILEPLFDAMPNILRRFPDVKLLVIGDGKYLPYFKEKSARLRVDYIVTFTGWLDISAARGLLHVGDVGYSYMPSEPTVKASNNMKIPQYMARGVAPIISDINDLAARSDFKTMGYVAKADDIHALETTLIHALSDRERSRKADRARQFALRNFNWDVLAAGFSESLLASPQ